MLSSKTILKLSGTLALLITFTPFAGSQEKSDTLPLTIMFYNVENLFDIYDDPLTDDNDFLPAGMMRWNNARYSKKITYVYKTILAAGRWDPPSIVALCEIENRRVLEDLIHTPGLSSYNYGIIHEDSPDSRGIDACMIFRKDIVRISEYRSIIPSALGRDEFHTRSILYVRCSILGDTIDMFICHWPSRRGGVLSAESARNEIAVTLKKAVDTLCMKRPRTNKTIIIGDLNCTPADNIVQTLIKTNDTLDCQLINLADNPENKPVGTYRYMGTWEMLDQIIVSSNLISSNKGLFTNPSYFRIFSPEFLLKKDPVYPGKTTFSTYRGYKYQGGFSDHLPVLLDLGFR